LASNPDADELIFALMGLIKRTMGRGGLRCIFFFGLLASAGDAAPRFFAPQTKRC
jgi:hypothetical protein